MFCYLEENPRPLFLLPGRERIYLELDGRVTELALKRKAGMVRTPRTGVLSYLLTCFYGGVDANTREQLERAKKRATKSSSEGTVTACTSTENETKMKK